MPYTIPSDTHMAGDPLHPEGHDDISDVLIGMGSAYNVLNTAWSGGADPSGSTDSTAAIQAAVSAAQTSQRPVYFPAGTYKVSSPILIGGGSPGALKIYGDGWNSQIKLANGANCFIFDTGSGGSPQFTPGLLIKDLYLNCNGANQTSTSGGIYARGCVFSVFDHVWVDQPYTAGIWFYQDGLGNYGHHNRIVSSLFTNGHVSSSYGLAIKFDHADENSAVGCTFQDNGTSTYPSAQIYDTSAGIQSLDDCAFVTTMATSVTSFKTDSSPSRCMLTNCAFDSATSGNLLELNGDDCSVMNCNFLSFGQGGGTNAAIHLSNNYTRILGNNFVAGGTNAIAIAEDSGSQHNAYAYNLFSGTFYQNTPISTSHPLKINVVQDYAADSTGTIDSYSVIEAALNALRLSTYGGTLYFPAGIYLSSQTLQVGSNTALLGDGVGITTIKAANSFAASQIDSAAGMYLMCSYNNGGSSISNVSLSNLTLDGNITNVTSPLPGYALQALCSPFAPKNITKLSLNSVEIINSVGYAAWIQSCSKVQISGCVINVGNTSAHSWNQQDGFHITDCTGVEITGCTLSTGTNGGDDPIAVQGVSTGCSDVTITGNTILASGTHGISLNLGGASVTGATISGNEIHNTQNEAIFLGFQTWNAATKTTDVSITGNVCRNVALANTASGITLQDGTNVTGGGHTGAPGWADVSITGNTLAGFTNTTGFGVYAEAGTGLVISNNIFDSWNAVRGIVVGGNVSSTSQIVTDFEVTGNVVNMSSASAGTPYGIAVIDSYDGVVSGNTVIGPGSAGTGIWPVSIGTSIIGLVVNSNRVKGWATAINEANGGVAPSYNIFVGNNCHGNSAFITTVGTGDVVASNIVT